MKKKTPKIELLKCEIEKKQYLIKKEPKKTYRVNPHLPVKLIT